MMLNSLNFAESSEDILILLVVEMESDRVYANKMHCIIIKIDEIVDIVLYDSFGFLVMTL